MSWDFTGKKIVGKYLDGTVVSGIVVSSRVKYGGKVQHTVKLDAPVQLRWRSEPTDVLLLDDNELMSIS